MDTFKEQQQLDDLYSQGKAPWEVWKSSERMTIHPEILDSIPLMQM
jgi:hypothetical protein